ncbi:hypothetical protein J0B02_00400 [Enterobacteriaceae bacterium YMB-R22]|uniref:hypothetical protein n=1 Tax=Tenebrionicola larvae TaxID=2815733 RepID=UPI0020125B75|nr:hypothetical protein [Tenebrionicola larvae]MBV4411318.1 hypothetical protein [Tenebrionicola larvae]
MFHLDNNSGVSSMPAVGAMQDSSTRWFTEGAGNQSPSWPGQDWFNIVQAELLNVLTESGITPVKTQFNQLALAIRKIISNDALLCENLLSEIKVAGAQSQAVARLNLGLGTAATATVTTSMRDTTPGRLLRVQDYGIGCRAGLNTKNIDFNTYDFIQGEHLFINTDTAKNLPEGLVTSGHYFAFVHGLRDTTAAPGLTLINYLEPGEIWTAYGNGPAGNRTWTLCRVYNTRFKPAANDVDAVSAANGGIFKDLVTFERKPPVVSASYPSITLRDWDMSNVVGKRIILEQRAGNAYLLFRNDSNATTGQVRLNFPAVNGTIYSSGNKPTAADIGTYTKAESDARYIQDIDHTAPVEKQFYDGQPYTNTHATDGAYLANIRFVGGMSNVGWFIIRYTRKKINGTWYTLS